MFLKPQVCVEYGNRTREHQFGHQSSFWLETSVLNFSDLTRTGVTHSLVILIFQGGGRPPNFP